MSAADNKKAKLYYMLESPPCRTVMLVARMLKIELDYESLDLSEKKHLKDPNFIAVNPFHVVPTLVETDGFALWESRVIASYLIETRAPESSLYPLKDVKRRATIDKFLHYDLGTFYRALGDIVVSQHHFLNISDNFISIHLIPQQFSVFVVGTPSLDKLPRFEEVLKTLNEWLAVANKSAKDGKPAFVAGGDELSLADISLFFSLSLAEVVPEIMINKYEHVSAWLSRVEETVAPWNEENWMGKAKENIRMYAEMLKAANAKK